MNILGATLSITPEQVTYQPDLLKTSLGQRPFQIARADVEIVQALAPTPFLAGMLELKNGPRMEFPAGATTLFAEAELALRKPDVPLPVDVAAAGNVVIDLGFHSKVTPKPGYDFVAVDVETAGVDWGTICQVGLVRYRDGVPTATFSETCIPPQGLDCFDQMNISIHGITPAAVAQRPDFAELIPMIVAFIGDDPLVAHNAFFDGTALIKAFQAAGEKVPTTWKFVCTMSLGRQHYPHTSHKLAAMTQQFGISLGKHHDAYYDALACGDLLVALGHELHQNSHDVRQLMWASGLTLAEVNNDGTALLPTIVDHDGVKIKAQQQQLQAPPAAPVTTVAMSGARPATAPRPHSSSSSKGRFAKFNRGPIPEPNPDADPNHPLFGKVTVVTGDFPSLTTDEVWAQLAQHGAQVAANVTKKTQLLFVGEWPSITTKQKRAQELQAKGQDLEILELDDFFRLTGLDEKPPF